ncbi:MULTISPECIES: PQQ-binding-like beta-propeller repeat protein [Streptomyces]|uniref:Pyrrolo-quinoline quinone repeat domain-containing protein n=1 Tax=Streptomyces luteosporeus TaxID=173856 RepID=A0ABP6GL08_9ACTN
MSRQLSRRTWGILLAVVLVLICGAGYWAWSRPEAGTKSAASQDGSSLKAGTQAWKKTARTAPSKNAQWAPGTWFTPTSVVKAEPDMLTAYDLKSGERQWSMVLDGTLCSASRDSDDGRVFLALDFGGTCGVVTAIDIRRGVQLWVGEVALFTQDDPEMDNFRRDKWKVAPTVSVSGGRGLITWATGTKVFELSDGKLLAEALREPSCEDVATAGGAQFVTQRYCADRRATVSAYDPKTLDHPRWKWQGKEGEMVYGILSTRPVVLLVGNGIGVRTDVVTLDDKDGKERSRIALRRDHDSHSCSSSMSKCPEFLVDGDTVYIAGKGATRAFDLTTGHERWTYKADANRTALPVAVQDGKLTVYVAATPERVGELATVATTNGKATHTTHLSGDLRTTESRLAHGRSMTAHLRGGRLLLVNEGSLESQDTDVVVAVMAG